MKDPHKMLLSLLSHITKTVPLLQHLKMILENVNNNVRELVVNRESTRDVYSRNRIISIKKLTIIEWHNYKHLELVIVRRDDDKLYTFKEGDYNRLRLQDIKYMLLLLVQGKLTNLNIEERLALGVSLRMFTRRIVIQRRVEDLQLGVKSYKKKLNLTKSDTYRSDLKRKTPCTTYSNHIEDQSDTQVITVKIEILLEPTSNKLMVAGNPVNKILLKLNLPDHKSILTDSKVTPTKHKRMTKPYSSPRFIVNCLNVGYLKMEAKIMHPICFRFEYIMMENFKGIEADCYTSESEPLFYNYLRPLTSQDERLYALAYEEDVCCLATFVRSFKLIDVYIEHGVTDLDCYIRPTRFRGTLSFEEIELDGEAGFADVAGSSVESFGLNVGRIQEPIVADVSTQKPIVAEVSTQVPIVEEVRTREFTMEDVVLKDSMGYGEDAKQCNGQEDGSALNDGWFFYDNEGIATAYETEYDVQSSEDAGTDDDDDNDDEEYLKRMKFVTNLVPDDVIEGEDVDVINPYGFNSDPGNDDETNDYKRRMLAELSREMEAIINARDLCPWVLYVGKDKHIKNWVVRTHTDTHKCIQSREIKHHTYKFLFEKIFDQVRVNLDILVKAVQDQLQRESEVQIYMSKDFRAKAKAEREIRVERNTDPSSPTREFQRIYFCLGTVKLGFRAYIGDMLSIDSAFMKGPFPGQGQYGQAYKNLLWRAASATSVKEFEKFGGKDKPVITLLEYIREYCIKRILNVQSVIKKCSGPLTPTSTRIMESIKKEAHLTKVQWNGANKYQVSGSLGDQYVLDVVTVTCSCRKWELTGIPCKHVVAACWNMTLNDRATPPLEAWVGRPKKKRKRSKHKDEPYVKDGKLSRKGRTITCQSFINIGHNKATCKGKGGNNAEATGSASRQEQQTEPAVGQNSLGRSGVGVVIGLSVAAGQGSPGGAGVSSQESDNGKFFMVDEEDLTFKEISSDG
nr:hypothetical protein [Tanacetum cinerariifolium]